MQEIDLTVSSEVDPYTEIAKRLFNEMLELILAMRTEGGLMPRERKALQDKYDKERRKWNTDMEKLMSTTKLLGEDNQELERENEKLRAENENLRRQLNEEIINRNVAKQKLDHQYALREHLSDASRHELERLIREIPPSRKGDDNA